MELFITAFTIGLFGSFHCIGMCGPIAFALPSKSRAAHHKILSGVVYNTGRIATYVLFGLLFGVIGQGISTAGTQQAVSIILGVLFILSILIPKSTINKINPTSTLGFYISGVKNSLGKLLGSASIPNLVNISLAFVLLIS